MDAIVSIHDVMPSTLDRVRTIINRLPTTCVDNLIVLVVPGHDWQADQIEQLRTWQKQGIQLAGHGWTHQTETIEGIYHRLHSLILSRTAAEHLCLSAADIEGLMNRNHSWFLAHGFEAPEYYVPPAWALGRIDPAGLARTPWRYVETTGGLVDIQRRRRRWLPLVGYEADTALRRALLTAFNTVNVRLAGPRRPLRISIHPYDDDYLLAAELYGLLGRVERTVTIDEVFSM